MRKTRVLFVLLSAIALLLLCVLAILLFHPLERNTIRESEVSVDTTPTVAPSPTQPIENEPPVSQENEEASVTTGTDLYMEFPVLNE